MKITKVEGVLLSAELAEEHIVRWSGGEMAIANSALVVIHTDEGITGIGDTYAGGWFYPEAAKAIVEHFAPLLIGEDPRDPTKLARMIWNKSLYWGRVGAGANAVSAIENALWDVAGQAAGLPVWQMLGGKVHDRIKVYASAGLQKPDAAVRDEMRSHLATGYRAVKIRVPTDIDAAVHKVRICREALGPGVELMVDAVMGSHPEPWQAKTAINFAHAIEEFDIAWLEEPCAGDDYEGYARVRKATRIPVSGGETSFGLGEFRHFFNYGSLDIAQPDACTSGGIVECKRICAAAAVHGVRIAPHAWGSGATVMANAHWAFTEPNVFVQEIPTWGFPLRDELLVEPIVLDADGCIAPPGAPGLGLKLTDDVRARYGYRPGGGATMRKG
ncbi:MAG: mandelate racemase/muconate lactonizing enzyme family protein [Pseudomonadota bacterium]